MLTDSGCTAGSCLGGEWLGDFAWLHPGFVRSALESGEDALPGYPQLFFRAAILQCCLTFSSKEIKLP